MITYGSSDEKILEKLKEFKPDVIGISLFSSQVSQAMQSLELQKNIIKMS